MPTIADLQDWRICQGDGWAVNVVLGVDVEYSFLSLDPGIAEPPLQDIHELTGDMQVGLGNPGSFFEPA